MKLHFSLARESQNLIRPMAALAIITRGGSDEFLRALMTCPFGRPEFVAVALLDGADRANAA
jgi:hypothetical protein